MSEIRFTPAERDTSCRQMQLYFQEELEQEIAQFEGDFLLDFFPGEIGACFYNRGLYHAQARLEARLENVAEAIYQIEKPAQYSR